jgi:hypothetical protein
MKNNQQGVLYFASKFKPEVLVAAQPAALDDFFVGFPSGVLHRPMRLMFHQKLPLGPSSSENLPGLHQQSWHLRLQLKDTIQCFGQPVLTLFIH